MFAARLQANRTPGWHFDFGQGSHPHDVIFIYFSFVHFNRCGGLAFNTQENVGATPFIRQV